jgi:SOS-response transcriptional repressor LexA
MINVDLKNNDVKIERSGKPDKPDWAIRAEKIMAVQKMTQKELARRLNMHPPSLNYYFGGHRKITLSRLEKIAEALSCKVTDLWFDVNNINNPINSENNNSNAPLENKQKENIMLMRKLMSGLAPVLEWHEAMNWREIMENIRNETDKNEDRVFMASPRPLAKNGHFRVVRTDSMTAPHGSDITFKLNDLIFVDPDCKAVNPGNVVVVCHKDKAEAQFFQVTEIEGHPYLKSLNTNFAPILFTFEWQVLGVVTDRIQPLLPALY